jgi:hypothetical protein
MRRLDELTGRSCQLVGFLFAVLELLEIALRNQRRERSSITRHFDSKAPGRAFHHRGKPLPRLCNRNAYRRHSRIVVTESSRSRGRNGTNRPSSGGPPTAMNGRHLAAARGLCRRRLRRGQRVPLRWRQASHWNDRGDGPPVANDDDHVASLSHGLDHLRERAPDLRSVQYPHREADGRLRSPSPSREYTLGDMTSAQTSRRMTSRPSMRATTSTSPPIARRYLRRVETR